MKSSSAIALSLFALGLPFLALAPAGDTPVAGKPIAPLPPREELATFQVSKGFRVELAAAEPEVVDPIAMAFDEDGRLFVVEMPGYPNGGLGDGKPVIPGRVKLLEDANGDGYFEKSTVYVDGLRFPTGVTPWKGGILIADTPDLVYHKDTDGDGKEDMRKLLYSGFGTKNIQQLANSLQFHFDNWIHGCDGLNDSVIRSREREHLAETVLPVLAKPVPLRGRNFRFRPDQPGSLEPTSGGGQYGLASDDWGNWFTCTNSQHLRHIVLPDHYLARNPHLAVTAVTLDIPDHGAAAKVYRISPFEPWRLERTRRRVADPMGRKFAATELVPGGFVTSACGLIVYRGGAFPSEYQGNVFVCDPANNLIHRDVLEPDGPTFVARRHDKECEFLASTNTWFRPVFLCGGPDGAIYVADFYREVIETPLSLPEDIQKQYNLQSRQRGRIWRIVAENAPKANKPALSKAGSRELVAELANSNAWWRLTAQRLLVERQSRDKETVEALRVLARNGEPPAARLHALWALEGLDALDSSLIERSLQDAASGVRENALRLCERHLAGEKRLQEAMLALVDDPSPRVRFQLAFTLGSMAHDSRVARALPALLRRDGTNPWMQSAILSSAMECAGPLFRDAIRRPGVSVDLLTRLATLVAAHGDEAEIQSAVLLLTTTERPTLRQMLVLHGLARGLVGHEQPLAKRVESKMATTHNLAAFMEKTAEIAMRDNVPANERLAAIRLLGDAPFTLAGPALGKWLTPQTASDLQLAAVQALGSVRDPRVADLLLAGWAGYSPAVRREVQEALFARPDRLPALLTAIEKEQMLAAQLDLVRRERMLNHPDKKLRERAKAVFAGQVPAERKKVVEDHRPVLDLTGDAARGKAVFKKNCGTCHRLENEGFEVGPDLLSALRNKNKETLLLDILDPSREVDPRYLNYIIQNKGGRLFTGLIAAETSASLILRRAERAEDTLLRADIDEIQSTAKSLMPEGLEKQMNHQELADVIAYLQAVVGRK